MKINSKNQILFLFTICLLSLEMQSESFESEVPLLVHKTPTCGCCKMWIKHLEGNGFTTSTEDHSNLQEIKEKYDIKPEYRLSLIHI